MVLRHGTRSKKPALKPQEDVGGGQIECFKFCCYVVLEGSEWLKGICVFSDVTLATDWQANGAAHTAKVCAHALS